MEVTEYNALAAYAGTDNVSEWCLSVSKEYLAIGCAVGLPCIGLNYPMKRTYYRQWQ